MLIFDPYALYEIEQRVLIHPLVPRFRRPMKINWKSLYELKNDSINII